MNFLELVKRLAREADMSGPGPASTQNQTGEYANAVDWIQDSYVRICGLYTWNFMWSDFSFQTTPSDGAYTPAQVLGAANPPLHRYRKDTLRCYLTIDGVASEQWMEYVAWDAFRDTYLFGPARTHEGRPYFWTQDPSRRLIVHPVPNDVYTITGEYDRAARRFTSDSDTPIFDEEHHMILVWDALLEYAGFEEASAIYQRALNNRNRMLARMEEAELPDICQPGPLA